jgi:hypothetical protein
MRSVQRTDRAYAQRCKRRTILSRTAQSLGAGACPRSNLASAARSTGSGRDAPHRSPAIAGMGRTPRYRDFRGKQAEFIYPHAPRYPRRVVL